MHTVAGKFVKFDESPVIHQTKKFIKLSPHQFFRYTVDSYVAIAEHSEINLMDIKLNRVASAVQKL